MIDFLGNLFWNFLLANWVNMALIIVGTSAIFVYIWQERGKTKDYASMIVLQIDELQERMQQIQSYITDDGLNFKAFYESLPLMNENYWDRYKHVFIRKIDNKSYHNINKFYQYVLSIKEQQELLRNLQKNYFFLKQQAITNTEFSYIDRIISATEQSIISPDLVEKSKNDFLKENKNEKLNQFVGKVLEQISLNNLNNNLDVFWSAYNQKRNKFLGIMNNNQALTDYSPLQISQTIKSILKQYSMLEITGTEGYRKLRKIAKMTDK